MIRWFCERLAKHLPLRVIGRGNGDAYLERYYLCGRAPAYFPVPVKARLQFLPTVFLHRFVCSDEDDELHNHPWDRSVSFILAGGYEEERRVPATTPVLHSYGPVTKLVEHDVWKVIVRRIRPFTFNHIGVGDFHRVDLLEKDAWTIFVTGKKMQTWGFWDRYTGKFLQWREHLALRKHQQANDPIDEDDTLRTGAT